MCKCPLELEKRKKQKTKKQTKKNKGLKKKTVKRFSSFHAKIVVEGFLVELRIKKTNPGLVCVHFCIVGVLGWVDSR